MRVCQGPKGGWAGQGQGQAQAPRGLLRSAGLHSPPLLGTTAVPGLVAPITNGFAGVVPFPGGHPALETVYANGLVPYPGNRSGPPGLRGGGWGREGVSGTGMSSCATVPGTQRESQLNRHELWAQRKRL